MNEANRHDAASRGNFGAMEIRHSIRRAFSCWLLLWLGHAALAGGLPAAVTDDLYLPLDPAEVKVGRLLFWDPILSGNRNVSCASCHHPRFGTSDGLSLGLGDGGVGLGPDRHADPGNLPEQRIPRNATALFNLGARQFTVLFHDGRIEADPSRASGLRTPLEDEMTLGFDSVLSAQSMFPVVSGDEMAGHYSENDISRVVRQGRITGPGGAWDLIAGRVAAVPEYRALLGAAYPEIAAGRAVHFTDISNAIAAFIAFEWRSDDSPFDAHLRGEELLEGAALAGMELFYGTAECSACHAGPFQTDHRFHAMGVPQIGPGKHARFESHARDVGRMRVTGRAGDAYAFRTPSLRNVTETAPYGHDGAYTTLAAFLQGHVQPSRAIAIYDRTWAVLPTLDGAHDWRALDDPAESAAIAAAAASSPHVDLVPGQIADLIAFLGALRDPAAGKGRLGIPDSVPSGLPVER